jgi:hypothetical protein
MSWLVGKLVDHSILVTPFVITRTICAPSDNERWGRSCRSQGAEPPQPWGRSTAAAQLPRHHRRRSASACVEQPRRGGEQTSNSSSRRCLYIQLDPPQAEGRTTESTEQSNSAPPRLAPPLRRCSGPGRPHRRRGLWLAVRGDRRLVCGRPRPRAQPQGASSGGVRPSPPAAARVEQAMAKQARATGCQF